MKKIWIKWCFIVLPVVVVLLLYAGLGQAVSSDSTGYEGPSDKDLRKVLSPLQYKVTRENGAEPPFKNEYWNNDEEGIYVDVVSGEPLFSSSDKFRSGTGRPSFTKPLEPENVVENPVRGSFFTRFLMKLTKLFTKRTEIRSRHADSHLGYLVEDGSSPTGVRYSVNSAALRFISRDNLEKKGYAAYSRRFRCVRTVGPVGGSAIESCGNME
jgi:peptide methionine sulfoxide reductase msrA/msrB